MLGGDTFNVVQSTSAAERNKEPIRAALSRFLAPDATGTVLEAASGAGTHAAYLSRAFPQLMWQPSEMSLDALPCIDAAAACAATVRPALLLDLRAAKLPGAVPPGSLAAVLAVNVTHITPYDATLGLLRVAAEGLAPGALCFIYGPFLVDGVATTESNAQFDASLRARDPAWGYRDTDAVFEDARACGLQRVERVAMPANNLLLVMKKAA